MHYYNYLFKTMKQQNDVSEELLEDEESEKISFEIHMHPMTRLRSPDLLDQGKNSLFEITCGILYASLPLILCFELNVISSIINMYLIGQYENSQSLAAVGLGTILANIFGFMVIENLSVGFSVICSYFEEKEQVGFMYQKTLGINFFICILVTPLLYLSDRFLKLLGFNEAIVNLSSTYVWALVPSFYLYTFYETTKNYLQSQGVIYPCLVIGTISAILHYLMAGFMIAKLNLGLMGAAWSKNISYMLSSLVLYLYIVREQPTKQSWIEWNIKATNNVHRFLMRIYTHEILTYIEALAFQILAIAACYMSDSNNIAAHFSLWNILIVIYFINMSVSHCVNKSMMVSIEENDVNMCRKKLKLGIIIMLIFSSVITVNLWLNEDFFANLFIQEQQTSQAIKSVFNIFLTIAFLDGFQIVILGALKTLAFSRIWKLSVLSFFVIGYIMAIILAFYFELNLTGLWVGWLIGIMISLGFGYRTLSQMNWEGSFKEIRQSYKKIATQILENRYELGQEKQGA